MDWESEINCEACGAWMTLPNDFFPDDARSQIYRALQCPNCTNMTMLCYTPNRGIDVVEPLSTYSMGEEMFGYFFPPFPMAIVPMTPLELRALERDTVKQRKRTKRNKRRWKIVYKGKLGEDASPTRHTTPNRKIKKNL